MADRESYREIVERETVDDDEVEGAVDETGAELEPAAVDEARQRKTLYHLSRFLELSGREPPAEGVVCPMCQMGIVAASLLPDPDVRNCERCNGYGRTLTGSLVEGNQTRMCERCNGAGFAGDTPTVRPVEMPQPIMIPVVEYVPPIVQPAA
jgi:hypothetical protein